MNENYFNGTSCALFRQQSNLKYKRMRFRPIVIYAVLLSSLTGMYVQSGQAELDVHALALAKQHNETFPKAEAASSIQQQKLVSQINPLL